MSLSVLVLPPTRRAKRHLGKPPRKPQLGHAPRTGRRYSPAYLASRRFARMRQRQRGRWAHLTRQAQQVGQRLLRAPHGMAHARERAFEAMAHAQAYRAHVPVSDYARRCLRELVAQMRAERLALGAAAPRI